jgi:thiol-disulfide isomerase/thioredoxin
MKLYFTIFFLSLATVLKAQEVSVVKFEELEKMLGQSEKTVQVFNFWATWCAPCVKELPYFESLHMRNHKDVEVILISLDFPEKMDRVKAFVKRKKLSPRILLLDESDANSYINRVDKSWSGTIPATLIINTRTGKRKFVGHEIQEGDLERYIEDLLKS